MASAASAQDDTTTHSASETSSVPGLCLTASLRHGKAPAQFVRRVKGVALGLAALGIRPGDRIALHSENRPEWSIADMAILSLGAINVPIYTTQAVDQIEFILAD